MNNNNNNKYKKFIFIDSNKKSVESGESSENFTVDLTDFGLQNVNSMSLESFIIPNTFTLFDDEENVSEGNNVQSNQIRFRSVVYRPIDYSLSSTIAIHKCREDDDDDKGDNIRIPLDISTTWYTVDSTNQTVTLKREQTIEEELPDNYAKYINIPNDTTINLLHQYVLNVKTTNTDTDIPAFINALSNIQSGTNTDELVTMVTTLQNTFTAYQNSNGSGSGSANNSSGSGSGSGSGLGSGSANNSSGSGSGSGSGLGSGTGSGSGNNTSGSGSGQITLDDVIDDMYDVIDRIKRESDLVHAYIIDRELINTFVITIPEGIYTKKTLIEELDTQQMKIKDENARRVSFQIIDGANASYIQLASDAQALRVSIQNENNIILLPTLLSRYLSFEITKKSTGEVYFVKVPIPDEEICPRLLSHILNKSNFSQSIPIGSIVTPDNPQSNNGLYYRTMLELVIDGDNNQTYLQRTPWATNDFDIEIKLIQKVQADDNLISFSGNYNIDQIEETIKKGIEPLQDLSFSIDRNTLQSTFSLDRSSKFIFTIDIIMGSRIRSLLGFQFLLDRVVQLNPFQETNHTITSFLSLNIIKHKYLYFCVDEFKKSKKGMYVYNESVTIDNVLGVVFLYEGTYGLNMMQHATFLENNRRIYDTPVRIDKLNIKLRTHEGEIANLNGQSIYFVISFDTTPQV